MSNIEMIELVLKNPENKLSVTSIDFLERILWNLRITEDGAEHIPLDKLIKAFNNGEERFLEDPVFNKVVNSIVRGSTVVEMLDYIMQLRFNSQEALANYVRKYGVPDLKNQNDEEE